MFEQTFKNIDDILHKDAGCGSELDYVEQTSWVLFLKYLDDLEKDKENAAVLSGKKYTKLIEPAYQWLRCDSNYSPIINETGQSFTAVQDGSYAVQINENGCIDTSNCVSFENVSINDIKKQARFSVYPTATAKYIYVDFHDICNEIELVVMDVNGKTVNKVTQKSAIKTQIELKGAKGLYYLTIKSNCGQRTFKVVKIN